MGEVARSGACTVLFVSHGNMGTVINPCDKCGLVGREGKVRMIGPMDRCRQILLRLDPFGPNRFSNCETDPESQVWESVSGSSGLEWLTPPRLFSDARPRSGSRSELVP